ncbi:GATA transcription factor 2 [Hibiscus syriacus]|uniref:GATA transcription factor n=1 Tax=Hibiscus syriacus TaxID=106335 RepID=A0A6A3D1A6_HIBSY|nr:GATA transcription factor 2-like [Hibiscus syriacus]KAE8734477.1 GATA transcription factor 2 [Hibiscus syriacus]
MDMYGVSTPEVFPIDDLLDLSNEELFSSASTSTNKPASETTFSFASSSSAAFHSSFSNNDFPHDLCLPTDDVAELKWLSQFVDDSFSDFPSNSLAGTIDPRNDHSSFSSKAWSKRSRAAPTTSKTKREIQRQASPVAAETGVRRCTHCASDKTPQWRTGPLGPKSLCNACGVRYKSGRLVPEYRPAASPTFVLTQHSNSHRKVLELRRQKELSGQQQEHEHHRHLHQQQQHDFEVC